MGMAESWMHRAVPPTPPRAVVMFRLSSGFKRAPDPGACGQAGALGPALPRGEQGGSQRPSSPPLLLQGMRVPSQGAFEPWRNRRLPHSQPIVAGFHTLFHSEELPEVSIPGSPFVSSSCT